MTVFNTKKVSAFLMGVSLAALPILDASATEGYFQNGVGTRHKAMAGAGVADTRDASALSINPAGLAGLETQVDFGVSIFSPRRKFTGAGEPGLTPNGEFKSSRNYFPVPNVTYAKQLDEDSTIAIGMYGNGGMNTTFKAMPRPMLECGGGDGVFCGGKAGVDLMQAFITAAYARKISDNFSIGVAPILVMQRFKANGLGAFAAMSVDGTNLTNRGYDTKFGYGARIGVQGKLSDSFRVGATYQTKISMAKFDKYSGLFSSGGAFDVPSNWQVGAAYDVTDKLTYMIDYREIAYDKVASIGDTPNVMLPFGAVGGPGFGWDKVKTLKFGAEYRHSDEVTIRAGFSGNNNPIKSDEVTLNILAPGVTEKHISGGFTYKMSDRTNFNFAAVYSPTSTVLGRGMMNPNHNVELSMSQIDINFGWTIKLGK